MRKSAFILSLISVLMFFSGCSQCPSGAELVKQNINLAGLKASGMIKEHADLSLSPHSIDGDGKLVAVAPKRWTSGFFPGELWYLYEYTKDDKWLAEADKRTMALEEIKSYKGTHDLGFMIYCSFGNALRLTDNQKYKAIMLEGADALISRFNPTVGLIKSWDHGKWQYPVIIDNMMNLEFLFWATKASGDSKYHDIAIQHADNTIKNYFREDWSSYHVLDYDTTTGEALQKGTHQGYADESAWSRGQTWGLYGFTTTFRETGDEKYLDIATKIADFLLSHPNLPADMIPYWDFNTPNIPEAKRDASAGAIMCSALFELSEYAKDGQKYYSAAEKILKSLACSYTALNEKNGNFIIKHCVGHMPKNKEIDVPLVYADYYFVEALLRYAKLSANL